LTAAGPGSVSPTDTVDLFAGVQADVVPLHDVESDGVVNMGSPDAYSDGECCYALYKGSVWSCSQQLDERQWRILVDRFLEKEQGQLAAAVAGERIEMRERIPSEVRRAVWIRDRGACARCGNRERLEFDHIVPVSRGGSSTERNVELLCERCNRTKGDSLL